LLSQILEHSQTAKCILTTKRQGFSDLKKEELRQVGQEIGEKLSKSKGPVTVVIPLRGLSICDGNGGPLTDLDADAGFIEGISPFEGKIKIKKVDAHVLDDEFTDAVMEAFLENVALAKGLTWRSSV